MMEKEFISGFSVHDIAKLNISGNAKFLLIYSLSVPSTWIWRRQHIATLLNVGERELRRVLRELRGLNVLSNTILKEKSTSGKTLVKKTINIDIRNIQLTSQDKVKSNPIQEDNENRSCTKRTCTNGTQLEDINNIDHPVDTKCVQNVHDRNQENQGCLEPNLDVIPIEMKQLNQWVFWRAEKLHDKDKPTKIPYITKTARAKSNDSKTWQPFDNMKNWQNLDMTGIGFVLSENDPYTIIDLDNCVQDGHWNEFAEKVVNTFKSYTELSPSGTGIHIVVKGKLESAIKTDKIEIYTTNRYMAMTGIPLLLEPIQDRQSLLDKTAKKYCKPKVRNYDNPIPQNGNGKFTMPKEIFPEGERNNMLAKWAGVLNTKNMSDQEYYYYLHQINKKCCNPALSENEVNHTGRSVRRYAN